MNEKKINGKALIISLTVIAVTAALAAGIVVSVLEAKKSSLPHIIFAQEDVAAAVGETKTLDATLQMPNGDIIDGDLRFISSDTSVLQFNDFKRGVYHILDIQNPPEKVTVTVVSDEYSVQESIQISVVKYVQTISLDYNGANAEGVPSVNGYYLHRLNGLPAPSKTDYSFIGWFTADDVQYKNGDMFMQQVDLTLKAKFRTDIKLEAHNGENLTVNDVDYNTPLPALVTPQKDGWTFDGWYTQRGGVGKRYAAGDVYTENTVTLYAKWDRDITLDTMIAGSMTKRVTYAAPIDFPDADFSDYDGTVFGGWYTEPAGDGEAISDYTEYTLDNVSALYALVKSPVTFVADEADGFVPPEQFYVALGGEFGKLANLPAPVKSTWKFDGWFTEKYGGGEKKSDGTVYDGIIPSLTLYASWSGQVSLVATPGNAPSINIIYGQSLTLPTLSTVNGWWFKQWCDNQGRSGAPVQNSVCYLGNGNVTLYARYEKDIKLEYNGEQSDGEKQIRGVIYGLTLAEQNILLPTLTRAGLVQRWETSNARSVNYITKNSYIASSVSTLYLQWHLPGNGLSSVPYTISNETALNLFKDSVNSGESIYNGSGVYIELTNDISITAAWNNPIADNNWESYYSNTTAATARRFKGVFDGNNFMISNLNVNVPGSQNRVDTYVGLFGYIAWNGTVRNVRLNNVNITGVSVRDNIDSTKGGANNGGIAGLNSGLISNCTVDGTVGGSAALDTQIGGIVGYMFESGAQVTGCVNYATVAGVAGRCTSHGGIVGSVNNGYIIGCTNRGNVSGVNNSTASYHGEKPGYEFYGGIAGVSCAIVNNCTNYGTVAAGYVESYGKSGGGEIVGYLHDGSDKSINGNTDKTLKIYTDQGVYSGRYYYSGVFNCTGTSSTAMLIGFVQIDHSGVAVSTGYTSRSRARTAKPYEISGSPNIYTYTVNAVQSGIVVYDELELLPDTMTVSPAEPNVAGLPGWGIALIVIGCVIVAAGAGIAAWQSVLYKRRKTMEADSPAKQGDDKRE